MSVAKSNEKNQNRKIKRKNQKQTLWSASPKSNVKGAFVRVYEKVDLRF